MLTFLKTAAVIACFVSLVPLCVWAGSGSRKQAWEALKGYLTVMGILVGLGVGAGLIAIIPQLF